MRQAFVQLTLVFGAWYRPRVLALKTHASRLVRLGTLAALWIGGAAIPARGDTPPSPSEGFQFGGYGRVGISTDLDGSRGKPHTVVSHGTRLEEPLYAEMDFRYRKRFGDLRLLVHTTLGFLDNFFHFTGQFESRVAIRNLYAEAEGLWDNRLSFWAGSRMYRGDDIYLFDFWPLDNLNTLGGGAGFKTGDLSIKVHVGASRLADPYQLQIVRVARADFGAEDTTFQDRQKAVASLKAVYEWPRLTPRLGAKAILWAEGHYLPSGQRRIENNTVEALPSDVGSVFGGQFGLWSNDGMSFLNVFVRGATGLAAYGDLSVPFGLAADKRAAGAREALVGLSANWETPRVGLMAGAYVRYFRDADPNASDRDDGWELAVAVRPHLYVSKHFQQLFEVSYQQRRPAGLSPNTGTFLRPSAFQFAVMPTLAVGRGSYTRPQFRLVYAVSALNDGARDLFPLGDVRRTQSIQHYLGFMAEWWFQGSYRY